MEWWMWLLLIVVAAAVVVVTWWRWRARSAQAVPEQRSEPSRMARPSEFIEKPVGIAPVERASATPADDLADIEGIGPRIHDTLNEAGITTFAQLAETHVDRLRDIIVAAELKFPVNPETWPAQARLAADGRWDELKQMQDSLKAGAQPR